jgi:hypothetical protein
MQDKQIEESEDEEVMLRDKSKNALLIVDELSDGEKTIDPESLLRHQVLGKPDTYVE